MNLDLTKEELTEIKNLLRSLILNMDKRKSTMVLKSFDEAQFNSILSLTRKVLTTEEFDELVKEYKSYNWEKWIEDWND